MAAFFQLTHYELSLPSVYQSLEVSFYIYLSLYLQCSAPVGVTVGHFYFREPCNLSTQNPWYHKLTTLSKQYDMPHAKTWANAQTRGG
ncbi:Uncharacterised protein [Chlamydia trachomatis]|nr:Uncharacterised protein [Chlamydia trachomatis]